MGGWLAVGGGRSSLLKRRLVYLLPYELVRLLGLANQVLCVIVVVRVVFVAYGGQCGLCGWGWEEGMRQK